MDSRYALVLMVAIGLIVAVALGTAVAHEEIEKVAAFIFAIALAIMFLMVGNRYWYVIPATLAMELPTFQIGARAVSLSELAIFACAVNYIFRLAFRKERLVSLTSRNLAFACFMAWITMVFFLNPIGFAQGGSALGGGRFYISLYLALASLIIISSQNISELDIKWVFGLITFGAFFSFGRTLFEYFILGHALGDEYSQLDVNGFYTWHQELAGPPLLILLLMFSFWAPSRIFSINHPWRGCVIILCIPFVLFSGKRAAIFQLLAIPSFSAILRKEYRYLAASGIVIGLALFFIISAQGNLISLPPTVQRALSWLPGDWDLELNAYRGGDDDFRAGLRNIAWEKIQQNPWISNGFAVDVQESATQSGQVEMFGARNIEDQVMLYALGHAWHNTWLGYSADFGIPLAVMQACIFLIGLVTAYQLFYATKESTYSHMLAAYAFIFILRDVSLSHTSGHSANDAFSRWWIYGMLFALARQFLAKSNPKCMQFETDGQLAGAGFEIVNVRTGRS